MKNWLGRYIVVDADICHGQPTFDGTRVLVSDVLSDVACGMQLHLFALAELVAKVTYNAAEPPDEFDQDSGWWIASELRYFVDLWNDKSFSESAWLALTNAPG